MLMLCTCWQYQLPKGLTLLFEKEHQNPSILRHTGVFNKLINGHKSSGAAGMSASSCCSQALSSSWQSLPCSCKRANGDPGALKCAASDMVLVSAKF